MVWAHKQFCPPQGERCLYAGKQIADKRRGQAGADIERQNDHVVWRLDHTKANEIIEKLQALADSGQPCHHYVDDMLNSAM
jgi:hypothetical protein